MDTIKLKLKSKKLQSERYQIGLSTEGLSDGYYGYLLAEPKTSVTEVIKKIDRHIRAMYDSEKYLQRNLFSFGNRQNNSGKILVFKNPHPLPLSLGRGVSEERGRGEGKF